MSPHDHHYGVSVLTWPLTNYSSLCKKYNEINVQLGQTGAGLSFEAINGNEKMKSILDWLLVAFPWWVNLHGWWRTNPTYNTLFSTADPGHDFAVEAVSHFGTGKGKEIPPPVDDEDHADVKNDEGGDMGLQNKELEPGQIPDESEIGEDDDFPMDENKVPLSSHTNDDQDWPDWDENNSSGPSSSLQLPQPQASSPNSLFRVPSGVYTELAELEQGFALD
ncbi:hypothetical protein BDR04DRAFT_1116645 [Suillus decipiens]|nr:hypothetical protein BDR04DRAFT_1116645 [Suillus decipiens]